MRMSMNESLKFTTQALPIILLICYLLFPSKFVEVSKHSLGKMIALFLICIYTYQDMVYGLLLCLLVILYYHQDMESFLSRSTMNYVEYLPKASVKKSTSMAFEDHLEKDFTGVEEAYPNKLKPVKKVSEALFRKEKCHQSKVQCKNQNLKNHVISHVYSELQFQGDVCNPCDPTCHFTIEKRQQIEDDLKPKNTHSSVLDDIKEFFGMNKDPAVLVHKDLVVSEFS